MGRGDRFGVPGMGHGDRFGVPILEKFENKGAWRERDMGTGPMSPGGKRAEVAVF